MIFGNKLQVVFNKPELVFAKATPITAAIARVGIQNIIEHNEVHLSMIKGVVRRPKVGFKGFIGQVVGLPVVVHIVVAHHIKPGNANGGHRPFIGIKQVEVVAHQIAETKAQINALDLFQLRDNALGKKINFLLGVGLRITKDQHLKVGFFF